jgi:CBS domain-containing protein
MQLREAMTRNVEAVSAEATIQEAAQKMTACDLGFLPVVEHNLPVGVITDRDIATRAVARGYDPRRTPVRRVMTSKLESMKEDEPVESAARRMQEKQIRRVLVEDINRRIVGVVTLGDLAVGAPDVQMTGETLEGVSQERETSGAE